MIWKREGNNVNSVTANSVSVLLHLLGVLCVCVCVYVCVCVCV